MPKVLQIIMTATTNNNYCLVRLIRSLPGFSTRCCVSITNISSTYTTLVWL